MLSLGASLSMQVMELPKDVHQLHSGGCLHHCTVLRLGNIKLEITVTARPLDSSNFQYFFLAGEWKRFVVVC